MLPAFESLEEVDIDGIACSKAYDAQHNLVGIAVEASSEAGFGGHLAAMVGFSNNGEISGYQILQTSETPGLGAKAQTWFQKEGKGNIIGRNPQNGLKVKKDGGDVDAISGSTITSRAFCEVMNNAYNTFQKGGLQ